MAILTASEFHIDMHKMVLLNQRSQLIDNSDNNGYVSLSDGFYDGSYHSTPQVDSMGRDIDGPYIIRDYRLSIDNVDVWRITGIALNEDVFAGMSAQSFFNTTLAGNDTLYGSQSDDYFYGGRGSDSIYASIGYDTVKYEGNELRYFVNYDPQKQGLVTVEDSQHRSNGQFETDQLYSVERLEFDDHGLALLMPGSNVESIARTIGVYFGSNAVKNPEYVRIGLDLMTKGMSSDDLAKYAESYSPMKDMGVKEYCRALANNVFDKMNNSAFANSVADGISNLWIASGKPFDQQAKHDLFVMAANSNENAENIDLVGISHHGLAYSY